MLNRIFEYAGIAIVTLLSLAAGLAKVLQVPEELAFLHSVGLSTTMVILFGIVQLAGGVLLLPPATRLIGALIAGLAFLVSSVLIFIGGNGAFALVSLVPVVLAAIIVRQSASPSRP